TTMASGVKTYNNAIAVDLNRQEVETVLEKAKKQGKATGLVATSQVNHATPASFGAHNESRNKYNEIADDFLDDQIDGEPKEQSKTRRQPTGRLARSQVNHATPASFASNNESRNKYNEIAAVFLDE